MADDFFALTDRGVTEHYEDALLYDYEYRRRRADAKFYRSLADEVTRDKAEAILEIGCGSGRVTNALLRAGHTVVGLDLSAPMLGRASARVAKAHQHRASFVRADMRRFAVSPQARVPLIVSPFNTLEHLYTRTDVEATLAAVRGALAPGGTFAFDVQNPDLRWLLRDSTKRWAKTTFTHPVSSEKLIYSTNHIYDPISQICLIRLYYTCPDGEAERTVYLSQRKFFPAELETLLWANGFRLLARYGDFSRGPLEADSESQIIVCQPV